MAIGKLYHRFKDGYAAPRVGRPPLLDDDADPVDELLSVARAIGYDEGEVEVEHRKLAKTLGRRRACERLLDLMVERKAIGGDGADAA